jgi:hypothetical protein
VLLQLVTLLWNLSLTPSAAKALVKRPRSLCDLAQLNCPKVASGAHNVLPQVALIGIEVKRAAAGALADCV